MLVNVSLGIWGDFASTQKNPHGASATELCSAIAPISSNFNNFKKRNETSLDRIASKSPLTQTSVAKNSKEINSSWNHYPHTINGTVKTLINTENGPKSRFQKSPNVQRRQRRPLIPEMEFFQVYYFMFNNLFIIYQ